MPRAALLAAGLLVLIGGAAWWVMTADGEAPHDVARDEPARTVLPAAGVLEATVPAGASDGAGPDDAAPSRTAVSSVERPDEEVAVAWFRGRLRVVEGTLAVAPRLASTVWAGNPESQSNHSLRLDAADLAFAIPAPSATARARIRFPEFIEPIGASAGGSLLEDAVLFEAPGEGFEVQVKVKPHLAVQFLHDPSGVPLAHASVQSRLAEDGSSSSWGEDLDEDGMLFFAMERRSQMGEDATLTFSVSRPPDVGSSQSPSFACRDLELLPQPVVLRFASSPRLRFRILDLDRQPIAGARARLGNQWESGTSDEQGWLVALQSVPPAETITVEADGFVAASDPVSGAAAGEGQTVLMRPASSILLVGAEQPAGGWGALKVEIAFDGDADGSLLAPERFTTGRFTESSGSTGSEWNRDRRWIKHTTAFSSEGRTKLDGIHVDVPAHVVVRYHGVTTFEQRVPIVPGDGEHRIEVPALPELVPVRGRVTDLGGRPLEGARLRLLVGGRESLATSTGSDGTFELGGLPEGVTATVTCHHAGFGRIQVEYVAEARDEDSIGTLVLGPGRSLIVQMAGPDGTPFVPIAGSHGARAIPLVQVAGERIRPASDSGRALAAGEWQFDDLPAGEVTVLLPGRGYFDRSEHRVQVEQARVTLALTERALEWLNRPQD